MKPLVSVVIPTIKERRKLLKRALRSVRAQTYMNIEVIIVDEGLPATIQRNIGIHRATGEYIAFLDDDDEWAPEKLEKQVALIGEKPCIVVCYSHDLRVGNGRINKTPDNITHEKLVKGFCLSSTSSYLVSKNDLDLLESRDGVCFKPHLPCGHEYDLALRLTEINDLILSVPEVLMTQHRTPGQISTNWAGKIKGQHQLMKHWGHEYTPIEYLKRIALMVLFFFGYVFGDRIYVPINMAKERLSEK